MAENMLNLVGLLTFLPFYSLANRIRKYLENVCSIGKFIHSLVGKADTISKAGPKEGLQTDNLYRGDQEYSNSKGKYRRLSMAESSLGPK